MAMETGSILEIVEKLLYHTRALAERQSDPTVDLLAHTNSCSTLLTALQEAVERQDGELLNSRKIEDDGQRTCLAKLLGELDHQTRKSREVLRELLAGTESELTSLRLAQKQVRAYRRQA